jgi:hypothetical protein
MLCLFQTFDKGWGLFSNESLSTNQFILEYCGELIDNEECERRIMEALKEGGHRHLYHMVLTDQLVTFRCTFLLRGLSEV